jgi:hypothetical protein
MEEKLKELVREFLTDKLEIKLSKDFDGRLVVELVLFDEVISRDSIHIV